MYFKSFIHQTISILKTILLLDVPRLKLLVSHLSIPIRFDNPIHSLLANLELPILKLMSSGSVPIDEVLCFGPDHLLFDIFKRDLGDFAGCKRLFDASDLLFVELIDSM